MSTPEMSDSITRGIRVGATAFYLPEHSEPEHDDFFFGYTILIVNESDRTVQLMKRHWDIIDAEGKAREVDGEGVVGEQPVLEPGKAFKYQSFSNLATPWGTMEGEYTMVDDQDEEFQVKIERFYLVAEHDQPAEAAGVSG